MRISAYTQGLKIDGVADTNMSARKITCSLDRNCNFGRLPELPLEFFLLQILESLEQHTSNLVTVTFTPLRGA